MSPARECDFCRVAAVYMFETGDHAHAICLDCARRLTRALERAEDAVETIIAERTSSPGEEILTE